MKKYFIYLTISLAMAATFTACKKTTPVTPIPVSVIPTTGTPLDHIKDSVYLFTQEDNLWYSTLPTYTAFNPRNFTGKTDQAALQSEVDALSQYSTNPATGKPYEYDILDPGTAKYSFIDQGQVATSLGGTNGDYGFSVFYNTTSDLRVKYVYPGSPADKAGLVRGYQITAISGVPSLTYTNSSNSNYTALVNAIFNSTTITMTVQKPDNTTFNTTLNTANYTVNPVLKSKVLDLGNGKKIGYLVFNTFTVLDNAKPNLEPAFTSFTAAGVTDLVVDLRYNGGGSVQTAEYLSNLIVPPAKTNTVMYTQYYNDKLQNDKCPLFAKKLGLDVTKYPGEFKPTNNQALFSKQGSLNINRVFFIVTGNTASASELTINNLIPEMNVQLIGTTSYGKPVGFYGIPIGAYQYYTPEFESKNSANQGGYYAGMTPGSVTYPGVQASDDVTHDFGDVNEALLARAINYTTKGTYAISPALTVQSTGKSGSQLSEDDINRISHDFSKHNVNIMISNKFKMH
ncbi:S41 family peptidase [uncultured Mucilaginibacter sp.]|uniref:S41 family peptidase n=1 Tax=uncultured Mucilaginibacter sp. TaxID=797541 RepID=UPI00261780BA|nr:S41 family peptidase [uncultured Mucilaginibacter sp.]